MCSLIASERKLKTHNLYFASFVSKCYYILYEVFVTCQISHLILPRVIRRSVDILEVIVTGIVPGV